MRPAVLTLLLVACAATEPYVVTTGVTTREQLLEAFGSPRRWHRYNKSEIWYYSWGTAYHLRDGVVVGIESWS